MKPLVVLSMIFVIVQLTVAKVEVKVEIEEVVPVNELEPTGGMKYRVIEVEGIQSTTNRRKLVPYQLCLLCKCCTSTNTSCFTVPCCFGIDCNLPNKPFGVCAFVPKTCSCTSCT